MKKIMMTACIGLAMFSTQAVAQDCGADLIKSTPTARFVQANDASEVFDIKTQLVWRRCALGSVVNNGACVDDGAANKWNWLNVVRKPLPDITAGGWRLPNIKELASITEAACANPAINTAVFYDAPISGTYMSNTPSVNIAAQMKGVDIATGNIKNINKTSAVSFKVVRVPTQIEIDSY